MTLRQLQNPPKTDDFTPLQEHQEQTPTTFFDSKPVLYAHYSDLIISAAEDKLQLNTATSQFTTVNDGQDSDTLINNVEIWVSSESFTIFQHSPTPTGVSIPYPSIALHATMKYKSQVEALYMNISLNDVETVNNDDDIQILELTILPPKYDSTPEEACIKDMFTAMNTCADLHPDPNDSDADEQFDETAPGATGWITADNMDEYLDDDGNFRGPVIGEAAVGANLGPGAGTVRVRGEEDTQPHGVNGERGDGETKWQRTG